MDPELIFRFFIALSVVIGLVLLAGALARRFGLMPGASTSLRGRGRAARRLEVVEVRPVDPRRRLVLVRRDDREHLLLIGGSDDLVVERGIMPPAPPPGETAGDALPAGPGPQGMPQDTQDQDKDASR
ncbi:flagellar biosynthetic protein FliO [Caenispirillum salinarum]|uniref:flagellar biosynthetic protein FliO n=1 Tax=Caenispirillum salinarum TaxID=859058 RepID=UPI00384BCFB7